MDVKISKKLSKIYRN